ncbi:MAG: hypothetical protein J6I64_01530 [Lachnospiraceae bacterium]|nr:hypothetical protein [Lachnospiraceae bacterium]
MSEQNGHNYERALAALSWGHPVYCRTDQAPDQSPKGLRLFHSYDCCAQEYWRNHPLQEKEKTILLLGDGKYAAVLLERGLLANVYGPERRAHYHVYGDWKDFCRNHHQLEITLGVDREVSDRDCLYFHGDDWNQDSGLLSRADRIILCSDDEEENLQRLQALRRYFPHQGQVHLRSYSRIPGECVFGTPAQMYTAELVMASRLTRAARAMHQIYADSAEYPVPSWEELSEFLRQSNVAAADHLLTKVRILLKDDALTTLDVDLCARAYECYREASEEEKSALWSIEHVRWMRFHSFYNWTYDAVRDNEARRHPLMIPYEDLPYAEQRKDAYGWELLEALSRSEAW